MTFYPGNTYFCLSEGQLNEMLALMSDLGLEFDLATDFQLADDGNYYANASSISGEEAEFLTEWGFNNSMTYNKSTQSTTFY